MKACTIKAWIGAVVLSAGNLLAGEMEWTQDAGDARTIRLPVTFDSESGKVRISINAGSAQSYELNATPSRLSLIHI